MRGCLYIVTFLAYLLAELATMAIWGTAWGPTGVALAFFIIISPLITPFVLYAHSGTVVNLYNTIVVVGLVSLILVGVLESKAEKKQQGDPRTDS